MFKSFAPLILLVGLVLTACAPVPSEATTQGAQSGNASAPTAQVTEYPLAAVNLSPTGSSDVQRVAASDYQRNLDGCMYGSPYCDRSALSSSEVQQVAASDYQRNLDGCMYGSPYCDRSALSSSEVQQVANTNNAPTAYQDRCAENGSCYGDISVGTGRPKTVAVRSYTRRDGTYVRGHYRSRPRR